MVAGLPQMKERTPKTEATVVVVTVSETAFLYFYHMLFLGNQSHSAHTQGERIVDYTGA